MRSILRANAAYVVGSIANSLALFLLIPFLVGALSTDEFGTWSILEVGIVLLTMIIVAGLDVGALRYYPSEEDDLGRARLFGTTILAVAFWASTLVIIGATLLAFGLNFDLPDASTDLRLLLMICWVESVFAIFLALFRARDKAYTYVFLSVSRMLFTIGLIVVLVQIGMGVTGILAGRLVAAILGLGMAVTLGARYISLRPDREKLTRVVRFGLPLLPAGLATYILLASDRYVLEAVATLEVVAVYVFAYKIASSLDVAINRPFMLDWTARRFRLASETGAPLAYAQILTLYLFAAVTFALIIYALTPLLYAWFAPPVYDAGRHLVPLLLLVNIAFGLVRPLNVGIMLQNKTKYLPVVSWIAAGICLGLNFWWIPLFGMAGAAWATLVAYSIRTAGIGWLSLRLYAVPYRLDHIAAVIVAGLVSFAGVWLAGRVMPRDGTLATAALSLIWIGLIMAVAAFLIWLGPLAWRKHTPEMKLDKKAVSSS